VEFTDISRWAPLVLNCSFSLSRIEIKMAPQFFFIEQTPPTLFILLMLSYLDILISFFKCAIKKTESSVFSAVKILYFKVDLQLFFFTKNTALGGKG